MQLSAGLILSIIAGHFLLIMVISFFTGRKAGNASFFIVGRSAPWLLVAWGIVGALISGITFISVPGAVGAGKANSNFYYMPLVFGNLVGYAVIALFLLPLFFKLKLISIYSYLYRRLGIRSQKTGAFFFTVSRVFGSSLRLYLMALVLHKFVLSQFGIPFLLTAILVPLLIWLYTFQGGSKTILITDTLQTFLFITALIVTLWDVARLSGSGFGGLISDVLKSDYAKMFQFSDRNSPNFFWKQFLGGALISVAANGLDQDIMQKHLSCRSIRDAQKNIFTSSVALIFVNFLFIFLGAALYLYAQKMHIATPAQADEMYPMMAIGHLSLISSVLFVMGLVACSYSTSDSALTALTTSFCIDFLRFEQRSATVSEGSLEKERKWVHWGFTVLFMVMILIFNSVNPGSILNVLFSVNAYLYGPVIGLFMFALLTSRSVSDKWVPLVTVTILGLSIVIDRAIPLLFHGFTLGYVSWLLCGLLSFGGLLLISKSPVPEMQIIKG